MFIVDGHLDLSLNAVLWERDLTLPASEIRKRERGGQRTTRIVDKGQSH